MTKLIAVDPGAASGIVTAFYDEVTPLTFDGQYVTHDGVDGFSAWFWDQECPNQSRFEYWEDFEWVCESFVLRANNKFVADLRPVEIIGLLKGTLGSEFVTWQQRTLKALVPDKVLKDAGEWVTGKMVGHTDGRDVNDAKIHALAYMMRKHHVPTLRKYFAREDI